MGSASLAPAGWKPPPFETLNPVACNSIGHVRSGPFGSESEDIEKRVSVALAP